MENIFFYGYFKGLLISFAIFFLLREVCTFFNSRKLKYAFTPLIPLSIILLAVGSLNFIRLNEYIFLILLGLLLSLIGDTTLMIEEVNLLNLGLMFFMLAHFTYIAAFASVYTFAFWNIGIAAVLICGIIIFYGRIKRKLRKNYPPVLVYMLVISTMIFFAFARLGNGITPKAIMISFGATLFFLSDSLLAVNSFLKEIPHSSVYTWSLYAPAQLLIAISCYLD